MQQYLLTRKGMLIGAAIIAILLLAVVLLLIFAVFRDSASGEGEAAAGGSDFEKPPRDSDQSTPQPAATPSFVGAAVLDVDAGWLAFPLAADSLATLDDDIVSMIGLLLESAKNTEDSKIAVDIPQLPDEQAVMLTGALIEAFITYDVPLSKIAFFVYRIEEGVAVYEVKIGFRS